MKCPFLRENVDENAVSGKEVSMNLHRRFLTHFSSNISDEPFYARNHTYRSGFSVYGLRLPVHNECRRCSVQGLRFKVSGLAFKVYGLRFTVYGLRFRV